MGGLIWIWDAGYKCTFVLVVKEFYEAVKKLRQDEN
jgi:hypothetical protein